jgi:hypothetical protein
MKSDLNGILKGVAVGFKAGIIEGKTKNRNDVE